MGKYYDYETFKQDVQTLVRKTADFAPDAILGIARGGLTLAHAYAMATDNRNLFTINSVLYEGETKRSHPLLFNLPELDGAKKVLILDDIVDSGETMEAVYKVLLERYPTVDFKSAVIYRKPSTIIEPDYYVRETDEWIDFFWETDHLPA
jgi:xanthine phosphoribosyltransferase